MNNGMNEDDTNVIPFKFNRRSTDVSNEIAHPESKWFDDPLEDLMNEFSDCDLEDAVNERDFISHLEIPLEPSLSFEQETSVMSEVLLHKVDHIKESILRLKYYLNEMNLED